MTVRVAMLCSQVRGEMGTFARCWALARGLIRRGHTVTVVAASRKRRLGARAGTRSALVVYEVGVLAHASSDKPGSIRPTS